MDRVGDSKSETQRMAPLSLSDDAARSMFGRLFGRPAMSS